jgi:hypothetical protein
MSPARRRALAVVLVIAALAVTVSRTLGRHSRDPAPRPAAERPALLLLTSLPLVFGEDFSLDQQASPALKALETRYRVLPISVSDPAELARGRLLLMAQPLAQTADNLVALDQWVRRGGRVLLLADPLLEWPSTRPLGDALRPPPMFMDTGLLAHWGLRLDAPDTRGPRRARLGGQSVLTMSPGALYGRCATSSDRLVAHCQVGKGRATIVADADLLDVGDLGVGSGHNLNGLLAELATLEER